jgi:hypothetical protein
MIKPNHIIYGLALVKFLVSFLLIHPMYELHRDEYLYLAESKHLAWGYLEAPPLLSVLGYFSHAAGNSIASVRFWGALFGAINLVIVGKTVLALGGKSYASLIACLGFLVGGYLRMNILFQPNFLEVFFWTLSLYLLIRLIQTDRHAYLYFLALSLTFAFYAKYSMVFLLSGMVLAFLLTPLRVWLTNRHLYAAILLFIILISPNLYWQVSHNFPVLTHMQLLKDLLLVHVSRSQFLTEQVLFNFASFFVWFSGLIFIVFYPDGRKYLAVIIVYLTAIAMLLFFNGKGYYSMGLYPVLFALGGFALERWTREKNLKNRLLRIAMPVLMLLLVMPILPALIPLATPERLEKNYTATGMDKTGILNWENNMRHAIPQDFADMLGWKELAEKTAAAYHRLPDSVKKETILFGDNYGMAGALNFYGQKLGLPEAYSDNASFLYWLPAKFPFRHVLLIDHQPREEDDQVFKHFESATILDSMTLDYAREKGVKIMLYQNGDDSLQLMAEKAIRQQKTMYRMQ